MASFSTKWTQEMMDKVNRWWNEGDSARVVAGKLGHGITRNAVLAKISRMRYVRTTDGGYVAVTPDRAPRRRTAARSRLMRPQLDMPSKLSYPGPPKISLAVSAGMPIAGIVPINNECVISDGCRYPTEHGFCGRETRGSYCDEHHGITHLSRTSRSWNRGGS